MAEVTTVTGMILSAMPVGEYDRRLVILTKEYGKITVFAKGARKPNSALIGVTRSFIFGTFEVYRGRESYTMYKASAKEYFENVVNDLNAVCYACYFAEIADYYGRENLDASEMINLLYITLKALGRGAVSHELIRFIYEIRMIAVNGECPDFFTCHECGRTKPKPSQREVNKATSKRVPVCERRPLPKSSRPAPITRPPSEKADS